MVVPPSPSEIFYEAAHIQQNRGPEIVAASTICFALALIAVTLRLIARRVSKVYIGADDYMIVFALFTCTVQVALTLELVHLGVGKHVILLINLPAYVKTLISSLVFFCLGTSAFKFAALLLFRRIFGLAVPGLRVALWVMVFVITANNIAEAFLVIFQCTPVESAWTITPNENCINIPLASMIPGSINVITDFVTTFIPIPLIWNLQMDSSRKLQIAGIFLLSGFVCIASIYRTAIVHRLSHKDATWDDTDPIIWAIVELAIGIISVSLPTLRPIYSILTRGHHCNSSAQDCQRCLSRSCNSASLPPTMKKRVSRGVKGITSSHGSATELTDIEAGVIVSETEVH